MNITTIIPSTTPSSLKISSSSSSTSFSGSTKLLQDDDSKNIICNKKNETTVYMIPTTIVQKTISIRKNDTITEHQPMIILNGERNCTSRIEVKNYNNSTECISAVTGSVSSLKKDLHVVKIQITPTENSKKENNLKILLNNNNNINNSNNLNSDGLLKEFSINSEDNEKKSKISIVSFGSTTSNNFDEQKSNNLIKTIQINSNNNNNNCENSEIDKLKNKSNKISSSSTRITEISSEMVQKPSGDLEVSNPTYLYYMMTSGQCSPSDTLDSGTCSDMENNPNGNTNNNNNNTNSNINNNDDNNITMTSTITPPPLPKKITQKLKILNQKNMKLSNNPESIDLNNTNNNINSHNKNNRTGSYNEDSEESESSLSCDSLNSSEFANNSISPPIPPSIESFILKNNINNNNNNNSNIINNKKLSFLPDSLLRDIRDRKFNKDIILNTKIITNNNDNILINDETNLQYDIKGKLALQKNLLKDKLPNEHELRDRNKSCILITQQNENNKRITTKFENDKYYKFHVNEMDLKQDNQGDEQNDTDGDEQTQQIHCLQDDGSFAGYRDIHSGTSTIRSSKGTVRGVKNRVRNGIATFLQMQHANIKNYKEKDAGKVVLYTTSMGIVRETYAKCANVKQILRTLLIKFEERDVFMSCDYQQEIKERMQSDEIQVPQLFVEGQYIGDAEIVERLNETGELRKMLKTYKSMNSSYTCQTCGGYRLLPCSSCNGSKKSVHRNHFTAEFVALKCMNCDEVGLVKCHNC